MEVEVGTALAIVTAVATAAGAFAVVRSSTQRLEAQRDKDTALTAAELKKVEERVSEKLREYAEKKDDQGRRVGRVEQRVSVLEGRLQGDESVGHRRRATGSIPIVHDSED